MGILVGNDNPLVTGTGPASVEEFRTRREDNAKASALSGAAFAPIGIPLGAVDTIGQSVGLLDDDSIEKALTAINKSAGSVYRDNETGYRVIGDIGATFTGAGAITKVLRGTSMLTRAGSIGARTADKLTTMTGGSLARTTTKVVNGSVVTATVAKKKGRSDFALDIIRSDTDVVEQMTQALAKEAHMLGKTGITNTVNLKGTRELARQARVKQFTNDFKEGVGVELGILAFQNESELFFPEGASTSDTILMAGAGIALGNIIGQMVVTPALKKAHGAAGAAKASRGDELTQKDGINLVMATASVDELARSPLVDDAVAFTSDARDQVTAAKAQSQREAAKAVTNLLNNDRIPGVTKPIAGNAPPSVIRTMQEVSKTNPRLVASAVSIDSASAGKNFYSKGPAIAKKLTTERYDLIDQRELASSIEGVVINNRLDAIDSQLADLNGKVAPVQVNRLGMISTDVSSPSLFMEDNVTLSFLARDVVDDNYGKTLHFVNNAGDADKIGTAIDGSIWYNKNQRANTFGLSRRNAEKVYAAHPKALANLQRVIDGENKLQGSRAIVPTVISRTAAHEQLDFVIKALANNGNNLDAVGKVMDLAAFRSVEDVKHAALEAKYARFRVEMDAWKAAHKAGANIENFAEELGSKLMLKFSSDHGADNYGMQWFSDLYLDGVRTVGKDYAAAMEDFGTHFNVGATERTVLGVRKNNGVPVYDDLLEVDYVTALRRNNSPITFFVEQDNRVSDILDVKAMADVARDAEAVRLEGLSSALQSNPYTRYNLGTLDQVVNSLPELTDDIVSGAKSVTQGQGANPFIPQAGQLSPFTNIFNLRGVVGSEAFSTLADTVQRTMRKQAESYLKTETKAMQNLRVKGNEVSAQRFLNFISAERLGWDLLDDFPDGAGRFKLDPDSKRNKKIANHRTSELNGEVPEFMPSVLGKGATPLVVDELAAAAIAEARAISDIQWSAQNIISKSIGRKGLSYRKGHTLRPTNFDARAYITDGQGKVVDFVTANTEQQAKIEAAKVAKQFTKEGKVRGESGTYGIVTRDSVEEYKLANNQMVTADALSFTNSGTNTKARGGRATVIGDVRYIDDMLEEVHHTFQTLGKQYTASRFANELENLRQLENAAKVENKGLFDDGLGGKKPSFTSVYKGMSDQLTNSGGRNEGSLYGGAGVAVEAAFGAMWNRAFDLLGTAGKLPINSKVFAKVSKELADEHGFDPANFAVDFAEKLVAGRTQVKGAKVIRKLAGWTQAIALKWGEVGHAMLTTASIATTTPHAIHFMGRLEGESTTNFKTRVGWAGQLLDNDNAMPDAKKLTLVTTMKYLRGDYKEVLADAANLGYTDPNVAEFMEEFTRKRGGKIENMLVAADKYSGMVSMKSEQWAREVAFLTGYELYKNVGQQGHRISMAAANDIANKAIADYRVHQRAELFRGNTGVPLAMFQTFAINYFQRMASAVENKAWGTALTQAGTQAFMFGGSSIAGYDVFNETILGNWDSTNRPEDLFREGFANEKLGQLMLYGTPSALPMVLGLDDGIALHTRGSMEVPKNITPLTIFDTPFFSMVGRSSQAIKEGFAAAKANSGEGGGAALREALIYAIPNRPLRGVAEIAQGYSTNKNGDIVNDEVRSLMSGAVHAAGLKTVRGAEKAEIMWRDSQTKVAHRTAQRRLSRSVEAAIRSDGLDGDVIAEVVEKYIAYGGTARGAKRWLKNRVLKAEISKFDRDLVKQLRSSKEGAHLMRYLDIEN